MIPASLAHILLCSGKAAKAVRWGVIPHIDDRDDPGVARIVESVPARA